MTATTHRMPPIALALSLALSASSLLGCRLEAHGRTLATELASAAAPDASRSHATRPNLDPDGAPKWAPSLVS